MEDPSFSYAEQFYGETDELGDGIAKDPVRVYDFNATIFYLLGIDHERMAFRYQGRQFRLTDVHGKVFKEVLSWFELVDHRLNRT